MDNNSTEQEMPKIEFPCLYPIKIIGIASESFQDDVIATVEKYTEKISADQIELRESKQQNYVSVRVTITATGEDQIRELFTDLKTIENVKLVL
ncbi:MAG: hypothetical protein COA96_02855 [SAR86 cluster bacterium]|uniref:UPF0250 protein COA96_02855 n=1 Tax=SAR86 cluster bacterium TaxID=2030880 RepID=A0A2A5B9W7_9GAMM|nr:MAG: hypothetical protein COA96_02855 [SAR86 cluster bacterium]